MMKNLKYWIGLSLLGWAGSAVQVWDKDILISTPNTSLVFSANYNDELRFSHYGERIASDRIGDMHTIWAGMNRAAYPAYGRECNALTALQTVHADGNPTTYLVMKDVQQRWRPCGLRRDALLRRGVGE